jgi:hypothetical protein
MPQPQRNYVVVETSISIVINVVLSALFMVLVFGRSAAIDLWGAHGLAGDFIPQTFMISAMSILAPTLLTRQRIRRGSIGAGMLNLRSNTVPVPLRNLAARTVSLALLLTLVLGGLALALVAASWSGPVTFWRAFPWKLAYGAIVALIATPLGLKLALAEGGPAGAPPLKEGK